MSVSSGPRTKYERRAEPREIALLVGEPGLLGRDLRERELVARDIRAAREG